MPAHTDEKHFNYHAQQLYALVADVERYPEFLPWIKAVRMTERGEDYFICDVVVHFKHITEQYRCRADLTPPNDQTDAAGSINVSLIKGPFHHLSNDWRFTPNLDGGCDVSFSVDFQFKVPLLDKIIGGLFDRATRKMIGAFEARAKELYPAF